VGETAADAAGDALIKSAHNRTKSLFTQIFPQLAELSQGIPDNSCRFCLYRLSAA
jgi:hypothetical protein